MQSNSRLQVCACLVILMCSSPSLSSSAVTSRSGCMWLSVCVPGEDARPRGLQHHWWLCPCGCGKHAPSDCLKMLAIVNPGSHYTCHFWIWMFKDDFKAALSCPTFSFPISFFPFSCWFLIYGCFCFFKCIHVHVLSFLFVTAWIFNLNYSSV